MGGEVTAVVDFLDTYNDSFVRSYCYCSFFLLLSWSTRCSLSSISTKVQSYRESTTCCWPVILTLSLNFLTCKVQVTMLLPTAALKGRDCAEGL